jgi:hypothetical protein
MERQRGVLPLTKGIASRGDARDRSVLRLRTGSNVALAIRDSRTITEREPKDLYDLNPRGR